MKKIFILLAAMVSLLIQTACAQHAIFKDFPSGEGVEKVYLGKAIMKLSHRASQNVFQGVEIGENAQIDSLEVISIENKKLFSSARSVLDQFIKENALETLMQTDDGDETTILYGKPSENSDMLDTLIISSFDKDELEIVILTGKLNIAELGR